MKHLILILTFLIAGVIQSQSLTDVYSQYIQPRSSADELRLGLKKIEDICSVSPEEKCSKAKASALYLLSNAYFDAAYNIYLVDKVMSKPVIDKAQDLYAMAYEFMPIEEFTESQKNIMLDSKSKFESLLEHYID